MFIMNHNLKVFYIKTRAENFLVEALNYTTLYHIAYKLHYIAALMIFQFNLNYKFKTLSSISNITNFFKVGCSYVFKVCMKNTAKRV